MNSCVKSVESIKHINHTVIMSTIGEMFNRRECIEWCNDAAAADVSYEKKRFEFWFCCQIKINKNPE